MSFFVSIDVESIEDLIDIVVPLFSNVKNKNVEIPEWKDHPYDSNHLKVCYKIVYGERVKIKKHWVKSFTKLKCRKFGENLENFFTKI